MKDATTNYGPATNAIHAGQPVNSLTGDVTIPVSRTSTFGYKTVNEPIGKNDYSRSGNPTRDALETVLASLDGAEHGLAYPSGLGAETGILLTLEPGDQVIGCDNLYGGTTRLFEKVFKKYGISFDYTDFRETRNVEDLLNSNTKMIWIESPTNPLMKLCDIKEISDKAHEYDENIIVLVDNTFMSPIFQKPLELGADIVLYSTTKYHGGHSDVSGGAITLNNKKLYKELKFNQNAAGITSSPDSDWLVIRGIKTLPIRMKQHEKNAIEIAHYLENHENVLKVNCPGLESFQQHELAKKQMSGYGGMMSFELKGGFKEAKIFVENLNLFTPAVSLGGVESLVEYPRTMSPVPENQFEKIGLTEGLVRLSVGIEDINDLIRDLDHALAKAY